jgi:hypothetical protein
VLGRFWARIREPKHVTVACFVGYVAIAAMALWALTEPPLTLLGEIGPVVTTGIGAMILIGAVLAAAATLPGDYSLERVGLGFIAIGLGGYMIALIFMHATSTGSRALQLAGFTIGFVMLMIRAVSNWDKEWAPRGARIT